MIEARDFANAADPDRAFSDWVAPHIGRMALIAARLGAYGDRDDVVQEALIRAWRKRRQYDPAKGSLASWLFTITANVARSRARRTPLAALHLGSQGRVRDIDLRIDLEHAVGRLPSRQRLAVNCYYAVGLSVEETAAVMGCSQGTVKSTLADARARLRADLGSQKER